MNAVTKDEGGGDRAKATINSQTYEFDNAKPDTRQMLDAADFRPADDCVLIRILRHGSLAIGLDEKIDLHGSEPDVFWAFRTDRIFRFTVDEHGFDWGNPTITEPTLRDIAHVGADEVLVLERRNEPPRELGPKDEVQFGDAQTDHLFTEKSTVTVYFGKDNKPFAIPRGVYTTEQLIKIFSVEPGYLLLLLKPDGELETLKPEQKIRVRNGMHFYSQVPGGGSS
jgi:hypothetical protein